MVVLFFILSFVFTDHIPPLNERIIQFVDAKKGRQVGSGECWDLAAGALEFAGAYLDRSSAGSLYVFGKPVDPWKDVIFPGDIIQFENVVMKYRQGNRIYTEMLPHHTAIVYTVKGPGQYLIAHQNNNATGRKVGITPIDLKHVIKGEYIVYRPVAK